MLNQCVTLDVMQSRLLSEKQSLRKELLHSGPVDPGVAQTEPPEIPSKQLSQMKSLLESLVNESSQLRALIDNLTVKHDSLEDMFLNHRPVMETTSATSESLDSHREASHELRQQIFSVRAGRGH